MREDFRNCVIDLGAFSWNEKFLPFLPTVKCENECICVRPRQETRGHTFPPIAFAPPEKSEILWLNFFKKNLKFHLFYGSLYFPDTYWHRHWSLVEVGIVSFTEIRWSNEGIKTRQSDSSRKVADMPSNKVTPLTYSDPYSSIYRYIEAFQASLSNWETLSLFSRCSLSQFGENSKILPEWGKFTLFRHYSLVHFVLN